MGDEIIKGDIKAGDGRASMGVFVYDSGNATRRAEEADVAKGKPKGL